MKPHPSKPNFPLNVSFYLVKNDGVGDTYRSDKALVAAPARRNELLLLSNALLSNAKDSIFEWRKNDGDKPATTGAFYELFELEAVRKKGIDPNADTRVRDPSPGESKDHFRHAAYVDLDNHVVIDASVMRAFKEIFNMTIVSEPANPPPRNEIKTGKIDSNKVRVLEVAFR